MRALFSTAPRTRNCPWIVAPADDATARKYVVKFTVRQSVRIRIDDIPLPAALEPHSVSFSKIFDKGLGVGNLRISGMKHVNVRQPASLPRLQNIFFVVDLNRPIWISVPAGRRNDDKLGVLPAG